MTLDVIGSNSSGNSYVLTNGKETLLVELGCHFNKIKKAFNSDLKSVVGALVSHEDGDHIFSINAAMAAGIDCYSSRGTFEALGLERHHRAKIIGEGVSFKLGGFKVQAFDVIHDANQPFGYLIKHAETGTILFVTDTHYIPYQFDGMNQIIIEANYELELLEEREAEGRTSSYLRDRILTSHMSYAACKDFLLSSDLTDVRNIVLIHLSDNHSNAPKFKRELMELTGKPVTIADAGVQLDFNLCPF